MPTVLITGASDGIGRALVDHYNAQGWTIIASGRRKREEVSPPLPEDCTYVSADLSHSIAPVVDAVTGPLDLALLNAGAGRVAAPQDHSADDIRRMVAVNTTAPLVLAQALYEPLKAANGSLAFIGSTAAKGGQKDFAVYAATKAALCGAHRSLKLEWQGKVPVLMIHPGPTATSMHDKAGLGDIAIRRFFTAPGIVARKIAQTVERGKDARFGLFFTLRHAFGGGGA